MKSIHFQTTVLILVILSVFLLCSCGSRSEKDTDIRQSRTDDSIVPSISSDSILIELAGVDSQTVFDLLRNSHQVEFKSSVMGVFVTAIDSIENGDGAYWMCSVNDSMPQIACDKYITKDGDVVKWCFRKTRQ